MVKMNSSGLPRFSELDFGELSAEREMATNRDLLLSGYFDHRDAAYGIGTGSYWLVVGPKGSGKSAAFAHLEAKWQTSPVHFLTKWDLGEVVVSEVANLMPTTSDANVRAEAAWTFLLWLKVVESLISDQGLRASEDFSRAVSRLKALGYLNAGPRNRLTESVTSRFRVGGGPAYFEREVQQSVGTVHDLTRVLADAVRSCSTSSRHVVAIDGLDSVLFDTSFKWTSLGGLLTALLKVNDQLLATGMSLSVVLAARSDVVVNAPGTDTNKLSNRTARLSWEDGGIGPGNFLWTMLQTRAKASREAVPSLTKHYFGVPSPDPNFNSMPEWLLMQTRLIPRDVIALMLSTQSVFRTRGKIVDSQARAAVEDYAERYFLGELSDNLSGVLRSERNDRLAPFLEVLSSTPSRGFTQGEIMAELAGSVDVDEVKSLLRQMFLTGFLGVKREGRTFYNYRRWAGGGFSSKHSFALHGTLRRAWGIRFAS